MKENGRKKPIPNDFIAHIVKLGFDAKDANRLYESKDDWLGMSSGGKGLCPAVGCDFSVPLSSDALFEHCRTVHNWRDYPCIHDNCEFVAYSETSFKSHISKFHSPYRTHNGNYHSCPRPGCKSAFRSNSELIQHEKVHSNNVFTCIFCPYVNAKQDAFIRHQRMHFNTRDYVCDICHKAYSTTSRLNEHLKQVHGTDEVDTQCPLCDRVGNRKLIVTHLRQKHKVAGLRWNERHNQYIVPKQIKKN